MEKNINQTKPARPENSFEQLRPSLFTDESLQKVLGAWFHANDSIRTSFVERSPEYDVNSGLIINNDGTKTLTLPIDLTPFELKQVVVQVDSDTFGSNAERANTGRRNLAGLGQLLTSVGQYVAQYTNGQEFFVNPNNRPQLENLAIGFYNFGRGLTSDEEPQPVADIKEIPETILDDGDDNLTKARDFVTQMVFKDADKLLKNGERLSDVVVVKHLGYVATKSAEQDPRQNDPMHIMQDSLVDKFINRFMRGLDKAPDSARQELDHAALRRGMEFLRKEMKTRGWFRDRTIQAKLGADKAKSRLATLRAAAEQTGDTAKLVRAELETTDKLNGIIAEIAFKKSANNPSQIVKDREINCIGATLVAGALLSELGINYRVIAMPKHSCLALITSDGRMYWRDMLRSYDYTKRFEITKDNLREDVDIQELANNPNQIATVQMTNPFIADDGKTKWHYGHIDDDIFQARLLPFELGQKSQMMHNLGAALCDEGDYDAAIAVYKKVLEIDDKFVATWYNIGNILRAKGDYDAAIAVYKKALRLDINHADAWHHLSATLYLKGDYGGRARADKHDAALLSEA
jgi:tetratricopeptide (TPR) repeat protein